MDAIDFVVTTTRKYIEQMPKSQRKSADNFSQVRKQRSLWQGY